MKWTIGMPSYKNFTEVFFTVQSLRMHHDLKDCEIVVVDNYGDDGLYKFIKDTGGDVVKYERHTEVTGVSAAKNRIFDVAKGEFVLCIDSHILIKPGALDVTPPGDDLMQGPLMKNAGGKYWITWKDEWRGNMWGIWGPEVLQLPTEPVEIWAMGAGFFSCRRDSWLGFNKHFRGFGGETCYLQEKYRKAGRKVWCDPKKVWMHMFYNQGRPITYPCNMIDRVVNYILGFQELGMSLDPIREHFPALFDEAAVEAGRRLNG